MSDKGLCIRNRNPHVLAQLKGEFTVRIWGNLLETTTGSQPDLIGALISCPCFSLCLSHSHLCTLASSTRVLVSLIPWFQYEHYPHMALTGAFSHKAAWLAQLSTVSPYTEDRQLGSSCIQYLIHLPITTKFGKFFDIFCWLLSLERLPASRDLVNIYHYPLPQGHSNGLSCMWDFRMVAFVLDAILSVKISP